MGIVVQKFGGFSLSSVDSIKGTASFVSSELNKGNKVVVVVSAMYGFTDTLCSYIEKAYVENSYVSETQNSNKTDALLSIDSEKLRECDVVLSAGEQISAGLLALVLCNSGIKAKSLTGWQVPILTDASHSDAFIKKIDTKLLFSLLQDGIVPVITGFQGVDENNNITTLQRGGSDTSAVALAVALKAIRCDIYGNVDGVYTADPSVVKNSVKISSIAYDEMLEISLNAKVLESRSVEIASEFYMPIRVLSSVDKNEKNYTEISTSGDFNLLNVSASNKCVGFVIKGTNLGEHSFYNSSFCMSLITNDQTIFLYDAKHHNPLCLMKETNVKIISDLAILALVGTKIHANNGSIISSTFNMLKQSSINIKYAIISKIKLTLIIDYINVESALKILHTFCINSNKESVVF